MILFLFYLLFLLTPSAQASSLEISINEIAWSGTQASASDEWIELTNNTNEVINLDGWTLAAQDGSPKIQLSGSVSAKSFFLLERTDEDTVSSLQADLIYTGALEDGGEILELKNADGSTVDKVDCSSGWFAGDKATKASMERKNSAGESMANNWFSAQDSPNNAKDAKGNLILGSPKAQNEIGDQQEKEDENKEKTNTEDTASKQSAEQTTNKALINEFMPIPAPETEEWVELFNPSNSDLSMDGWTLFDGRPQKLFDLQGNLAKNDFMLVKLAKHKLNNDGDLLVLKNEREEVVDQIAFGQWDDGNLTDNAPLPTQNYSLARIEDGQDTNIDKDDFAVLKNPTPGTALNVPIFIEQSSAIQSPAENTQQTIVQGENINKLLPEEPSDPTLPKTGSVFSVILILITCLILAFV